MGLFSDTDEEKENSEYENIKNLKYSGVTRVLTAKASFGEDSYNEMYLGVPEDRKTTDNLERRINYIKLNILEVVTDDLEWAVKAGSIGYIKPDTELGDVGEVYAQFYVPTNVFDDIENMTAQPDTDFQITINRKGWEWTGPIGDGQVYIDTENREKVEFAGIAVSKRFKELETETIQDENVILENYSDNAIEANMHIFKKLSDLGGYMNSIKLATWIIALGIIYIAIKSN